MASWLDAILEFTVLKHEALILTVKKQNILQKIKNISIEWPKKKQFIERAYKILLFTKRVKPEINLTMQYLRENDLYDFMNKDRMENNKVYMKIKEIESREQRLIDSKKKIEECANCCEKIGDSDKPDIGRLQEVLEGMRRNTNEERQSVEIQTSVNQEMQTNEQPSNQQYDQRSDDHNDQHSDEQRDENQLDQYRDENSDQNRDEYIDEPRDDHRNEQRDEHQCEHEHYNEEQQVNKDLEQEEYKNVSGEDSELEFDPDETNRDIVYGSIRERYAKRLQRQRTKRDQQRQAQMQRVSRVQQHVGTDNVQQEITNEDTLPPGEDPSETQGLIQLLSSKLLCQILSAGDLFQTHIAEHVEEQVERLRNQYFTIWYENILKARIFLADRHEKVERALQKIGLVPKDEEDNISVFTSPEDPKLEEFDIEEVDTDILEEKLRDPETLKAIYKFIQDDDENYDF
jgi:hypothetical protein